MGNVILYRASPGCFFVLANIILLTSSFGLLHPWLICWEIEQRTKKMRFGNTTLKFNGNGASLFCDVFFFNWILTIVTFGFWVFCGYGTARMNKWIDDHIDICTDGQPLMDYSH